MFFCEQMDMLRVIVLLGRYRHHHVFPCHADCRHRLFHIRDMLQDFQERDYVHRMIGKGLGAARSFYFRVLAGSSIPFISRQAESQCLFANMGRRQCLEVKSPEIIRGLLRIVYADALSRLDALWFYFDSLRKRAPPCPSPPM